MWNFKGTLWNSTQNILSIHWKMRFVYNIEILRAHMRFWNAPLSTFMTPKAYQESQSWIANMAQTWFGLDIKHLSSRCKFVSFAYMFALKMCYAVTKYWPQSLIKFLFDLFYLLCMFTPPINLPSSETQTSHGYSWLVETYWAIRII